MNFLFVCKCPHCGKKGISTLRKYAKYSNKIKCVYCGKQVRFNYFLGKLMIVVTIGLAVLMHKLFELLHFPIFLSYIFAIVFYILLSYLIPVKKVEE